MALPTLQTLTGQVNQILPWSYTGSDGRALILTATLAKVAGTVLHLAYKDGVAQVDYSRVTAVGNATAGPVTVPH